MDYKDYEPWGKSSKAWFMLICVISLFVVVAALLTLSHCCPDCDNQPAQEVYEQTQHEIEQREIEQQQWQLEETEQKRREELPPEPVSPAPGEPDYDWGGPR